MSDAASPHPAPAPAALTPAGTPVVPLPVQGPQQVPPDLQPLFTAALNAMPPGALQMLLKQYWGYAAVALVPLMLTTWTNLKEIWSGPASVAAITQAYAVDHKEVVDLKSNLDTLTAEVKRAEEESKKAHEELNTKIDRVLWYAQQRPGMPASQPYP